MQFQGGCNEFVLTSVYIMFLPHLDQQVKSINFKQYCFLLKLLLSFLDKIDKAQ